MSPLQDLYVDSVTLKNDCNTQSYYIILEKTSFINEQYFYTYLSYNLVLILFRLIMSIWSVMTL